MWERSTASVDHIPTRDGVGVASSLSDHQTLAVRPGPILGAVAGAGGVTVAKLDDIITNIGLSLAGEGEGQGKGEEQVSHTPKRGADHGC